MGMRHKQATVAVVVVLMMAVLVLVGIAGRRSPKAPAVRVSFLYYTNNSQGDLAALLEIKNQSEELIARNSCRISPEPSGDSGYWYAADVPSHRLAAGASERLVISFKPHPMTRWRATVVYVWNPSEFRFRAMRCIDWLGDHGLAPPLLEDWRDGLNRAESSTDWIVLPASNATPNKITGPNAGGRRQLPIPTPPTARVGQFWR